LVLPVVLLAAVRHARVRRAAITVRLGGPPGLRTAASDVRRTAMGLLVVIAVVVAVVAAARPQWGSGEQPLQQRGIDLVIALDVSRSMLAEDVAPNRAGAAAAGLEEMLTHLTGNRVGLVTFAGTAFERAPLTVDLDVLSSMVARSQSEAALVTPGTDLAGAIETALTVLDVPDAARGQAILVVSDGEDLESGLAEAIRRAQDRGVPVYTVFAATTTPTALPEASGGTDITTGDPETLAEIATATGGRSREVRQTAGLAVDFRRIQQTEFASETQPAPIERFGWFAGAALALVLVAIAAGEGRRSGLPRLRGGLITAVLAGAILAGCGTATWRHVERGNEAYEGGRYEDALAAYQAAASELQEESPE
ncbi:MAG: VWA domain-containing protein, partial [Dehalococcoidia bacterium]